MIVTPIEYEKTVARLLNKIGNEHGISFRKFSTPPGREYLFSINNRFQITLHFGQKEFVVPTLDPIASFNNEELFEKELRKAVSELTVESF